MQCIRLIKTLVSCVKCCKKVLELVISSVLILSHGTLTATGCFDCFRYARHPSHGRRKQRNGCKHQKRHSFHLCFLMFAAHLNGCHVFRYLRSTRPTVPHESQSPIHGDSSEEKGMDLKEVAADVLEHCCSEAENAMHRARKRYGEKRKQCAMWWPVDGLEMRGGYPLTQGAHFLLPHLLP